MLVVDPRYAELHARLTTVGVTGTNGKTTTTCLLAAIVAAAGEPAARITTLGAWVDDRCVGEDTSLETFERAIEAAVGAGVRTLALEITSEALAGGFSQRWPAKVGVLTSFSRDHLDVHGSPETYLAAKSQLFTSLAVDGTAVLDRAEPVSALVDEFVPASVSRRWWRADGQAQGSALAARLVVTARDGVTVHLHPSPLAERLGGTLRTRMVGAVHGQNALAAALAADALGYPAEAISRGIATCPGVPGRFEVVCQAPLVVVDFAHTPDALAATLATARELIEPGAELWCVFGCGGDRDPGKRPEMGRAADQGADHVVLTNDNPRSEPPEAIAAEIQQGAGGEARWSVRLDRRGAIETAVAALGVGDALVVAGRGAEPMQQIAGRSVILDDRTVARAACERRGERASEGTRCR